MPELIWISETWLLRQWPSMTYLIGWIWSLWGLFQEIPQLKSLCSNPLCHTLSKTFEISKVIMLYYWVTHKFCVQWQDIISEPRRGKSILLVAQEIVEDELLEVWNERFWENHQLGLQLKNQNLKKCSHE